MTEGKAKPRKFLGATARQWAIWSPATLVLIAGVAMAYGSYGASLYIAEGAGGGRVFLCEREMSELYPDLAEEHHAPACACADQIALDRVSALKMAFNQRAARQDMRRTMELSLDGCVAEVTR